MITERKRMMTYTYFNRSPGMDMATTHLFSPVKKNISMMARVPFPTMTINLTDPQFVKSWSSSARNKINKATREILTVDRGPYLISDILNLFRSTATLKGLRGYHPDDFDQFPHIECSAIFYEGVMLCSHIWVIDDAEKRALLYVNASNHHNENDDKSLTGRAHYFLLWQDGLLLQSLGIETMDLMGYMPDTTNTMMKGVYQWKAATHGKQETLYHYYPFWFYLLRKFRNMLTG
jgi:hypothetical protein